MALLITKQIELNDKKKFAKAALDEQLETFVIYVAALKPPQKSAKMIIYPLQVA